MDDDEDEERLDNHESGEGPRLGNILVKPPPGVA